MGGVVTSDNRASVPLGPTSRDWFTLVASVVFTAMGVFVIVVSGKPLGYGCTAFFSGCTVFHGWMLGVKMQAQRDPFFESVEAMGSVPLHSKPSQFVGLALWLCVSGVTMALTSAEAGLTMTWISWSIVGMGVFMLFWFLSGRLVTPFLQFEPEGLRFGQKKFSFLLAWDNIATVKHAKAAHHQALFLTVHNRDKLLATSVMHAPPRADFNPIVGMLEANQSYYKTDLVIFPFQYGTQSVLLAKAIQTYVQNKESRSELAPKQVLVSPTLSEG